ncbi:hypothetical protein XINFAN_01757 [Pseudogemmobacter humi]|uniref:Uncharacterized protein n=1 Tax=Pseudogemmobacter humi TaxID=2483812 RepID=A0A3P5XHI3_9RHOB|nr:hypothetical protein XINFAN_01757 [Pseudogemmobacter humi]
MAVADDCATGKGLNPFMASLPHDLREKAAPGTWGCSSGRNRRAGEREIRLRGLLLACGSRRIERPAGRPGDDGARQVMAGNIPDRGPFILGQAEGRDPRRLADFTCIRTAGARIRIALMCRFNLPGAAGTGRAAQGQPGKGNLRPPSDFCDDAAPYGPMAPGARWRRGLWRRRAAWRLQGRGLSGIKA